MAFEVEEEKTSSAAIRGSCWVIHELGEVSNDSQLLFSFEQFHMQIMCNDVISLRLPARLKTLNRAHKRSASKKLISCKVMLSIFVR